MKGLVGGSLLVGGLGPGRLGPLKSSPAQSHCPVLLHAYLHLNCLLLDK